MPDGKDPHPKPPEAEPGEDEIGLEGPGKRRGVPTAEELDRILISGKTTLKGKIAALRLCYRNKVDPSLRAFSSVLTGTGFELRLRIAAIRILTEVSAADPKARGLLEAYATSHSSSDPGRDQALGAVLRFGSDEELSRCSDVLFRERDSASVAAAAGALAGNPLESAKSLLLSLSSSHPDPATRHMVEEARTGTYCPDHQPAQESGSEDE